VIRSSSEFHPRSCFIALAISRRQIAAADDVRIMDWRVRFLAFLASSFAHQAIAADRTTPDFALEGSIPIYFGDNPAHELQRHFDYDFAPYFKLSAYGNLSHDFRYTLYFSAGAETFYSLHREDDTFAALTGQISRRWHGFEVGVSYARSLYYDGLFARSFNRANDFGAFAKYTYEGASGRLRIQPGTSYTLRSDDSGSVQRKTFQLKADLEQKLAGRWAFVFTPRVQFYDYLSFPAHRDTVLSLTAGMKYKITENLDLTPVIGYENRTSTLSLRNYTNRFVGASLDFSFALSELSGRKSQTQTGTSY
jgi:hypothetical protein